MIAKHFNFVGDSVPQGPLAYGTEGVKGLRPRKKVLETQNTKHKHIKHYHLPIIEL